MEQHSFQEVMRQIARYCNSQNGCASCELSKITDDHCPSDLFADDNGANIENEVMAWAAEHPEPVYPTWGEWFVENGDLIDGWQNATNAAWMANTALDVFMKPIPADIAEKLGIEPKEG